MIALFDTNLFCFNFEKNVILDKQIISLEILKLNSFIFKHLNNTKTKKKLQRAFLEICYFL